MLGDPFESLIVNVPFAFAAPNVTIGVVFDNVRGEAPDSVTVPEAAIVVAPAIAPVFVMPPVLLSIPPVIEAPSYRDWETDRKSTRLNSSHMTRPRMPSSA